MKVEDFHLPLNRALLCAEETCGHIYSMPRECCPSCGSTSALTLGKILGDRNELVSGLQAFNRLLLWAGKRPRQK
jgi:hypothetical protein